VKSKCNFTLKPNKDCTVKAACRQISVIMDTDGKKEHRKY
jgi:hypothetical protein